jgi:hypothetical protein
LILNRRYYFHFVNHYISIYAYTYILLPVPIKIPPHFFRLIMKIPRLRRNLPLGLSSFGNSNLPALECLPAVVGFDEGGSLSGVELSGERRCGSKGIRLKV